MELRNRIVLVISIHAPRVGSDYAFTTEMAERMLFQSTLPVWGATADAHPRVGLEHISIHAPRVGSDRSYAHRALFLTNFNPRSPCGERLQSNDEVPSRVRISIHAPRVGSDAQMSAEQFAAA